MKLNRLVMLGTIAFGIGGQSAANAASIAASTGHDVWNYANEACMRKTYVNGGVRNDCGGIGTAELWAIELPIDGQPDVVTSYTPTISGTRGGLTQTGCIVRALDAYGNMYSQSNWGYFPSDGSGYTTITPGHVTVPGNGTLQVQCSIGSGAILQSISY
jgi:hypothetical protein